VAALMAKKAATAGEKTSEKTQDDRGQDYGCGEGHRAAVPSETKKGEVGRKHQDHHHDGHEADLE